LVLVAVNFACDLHFLVQDAASEAGQVVRCVYRNPPLDPTTSLHSLWCLVTEAARSSCAWRWYRISHKSGK